MNKTIEIMMSEHRIIEQVLRALETFAGHLQQSRSDSRETLARFALFFQKFADQCHHGKEEDRLFPTLVRCGFPREYGPIAVMLAEHDQGRSHVKALASLGQGQGPLNQDEIQSAIDHALAFVPLLLSHIQKEDHILYPMAQQSIPPVEFDRLDAACAAFEKEIMGTDEIQRLHFLAIELTNAYPPESAAVAAAAACAGCHAHG